MQAQDAFVFATLSAIAIVIFLMGYVIGLPRLEDTVKSFKCSEKQLIHITEDGHVHKTTLQTCTKQIKKREKDESSDS